MHSLSSSASDKPSVGLVGYRQQPIEAALQLQALHRHVMSNAGSHAQNCTRSQLEALVELSWLRLELTNKGVTFGVPAEG